MFVSLWSLARGEGALIFDVTWPELTRVFEPLGDMLKGAEGDLDLGKVLHVMLPRGVELRLVTLPRGLSH